MKIIHAMYAVAILGIFFAVGSDKINHYFFESVNEERNTFCGKFTGLYSELSKGASGYFIYVSTPNGGTKKFRVNQFVNKDKLEKGLVKFKFNVREGDQICVVTQKMFFGNKNVLNIYKD
jgi:hypothetical protein